MGNLPTKLAKEVRTRFAYAIDPNSEKFSPILSAATILNPEFFPMIPPYLFDAGKQEVERWFKRIPNDETQIVTQPVQYNRLSRLAAQNNKAAFNPDTSFKRYF